MRLITSILVGILIGKLTDETVQHENPLVQQLPALRPPPLVTLQDPMLGWA